VFSESAVSLYAWPHPQTHWQYLVAKDIPVLSHCWQHVSVDVLSGDQPMRGTKVSHTHVPGLRTPCRRTKNVNHSCCLGNELKLSVWQKYTKLHNARGSPSFTVLQTTLFLIDNWSINLVDMFA